ncbi:adenylate/guanylate cyclase domain-containing protein [Granulosicoccus sp.]|nr:adenylate/guanylate cyclase domain-containing protein [Granulosicoccus sp.]MDB4223526.1 adenylate/guanylate cyclase domain-containing protein [Granulosicoccus sp.]
MDQSPRLLTILFADIGGSAALYERVGDEKAHQLVAQSLASMKLAVRENDGKVLRTVGDSVLASFETSNAAYMGAKSIQQAHLGMPVSVRVGFHTGTVIPDGGDVYGHAVNIAARVAAFARVDEIVATLDAVKELDEEFRLFASDVDHIDVKGVPIPVAIHRLDWREQEQAATRVSNRGDYHRVSEVNQRLKLQYGALTLHAGIDCSDVMMGRAEENQIVVLNDEASRQHAQILYKRGQFLLQDLSTNGTYVKKDGLQAFHVRRDSIVLDGKGILSLGVLPDQSANEIVQFELIQD